MKNKERKNIPGLSKYWRYSTLDSQNNTNSYPGYNNQTIQNINNNENTKSPNDITIEEDIRNLREQKKNNEELRKYMEVEELSNKKTQADYIKSQQIIADEKRRAIELEKKNRIKEELERKIAEEEERIQLAEGKKQQLEQEEIEIMKKLKTTTQMHEQMVENYENLGKTK